MSLRRRTKNLVDDLEIFLSARQADHPQYASSDKTPSPEQEKVNRVSQLYDQETETLCLVRFGEGMAGIPRELRAKGLDVKWLDRLDPPRCLNQQDAEMLLNLAYHLDGKDRVVHF
jgi:hypothetical protein